MKRRDKVLEIEREHGRENGSVLDIVKADKTAETLFKLTVAKHNTLSVMADNKAHLMLTVCAGIIGFTFKNLFDPIYVYATAVLIASCAVSAGFAVYVTMPRLGIGGQPTTPDDPHFNLILFNDFARMPYDLFERDMELMIRDQRKVYRAMIKDLYGLGNVLHFKKYRYLRYCYIVFLVGLLVSAIVLAATLAFLPPVE